MKGKLDFNGELWGGITEDAKKLIQKMMELDSSKRISIKEALADNWFTKLKQTQI